MLGAARQRDGSLRDVAYRVFVAEAGGAASGDRLLRRHVDVYSCCGCGGVVVAAPRPARGCRARPGLVVGVFRHHRRGGWPDRVFAGLVVAGACRYWLIWHGVGDAGCCCVHQPGGWHGC